MVGEIKLEQFDGLTKMPQRATSAWTAALDNPEKPFTGSSFKPVLYGGEQPVRGINYWFIAEQTLATMTPERHLVKLAINEFNGEYAVVKDSIVRIF